MIKKGTARPFKKIIGILLLVMAAGFALDITAVKEIVMNYAIVSIGILAFAGYFLAISGRQL